jgi:two-component system response regulator AtoC
MKKLKILLIEDDMQLRASLKLYFDAYDMTTANTGREGIKMLTAHNFNLAILDLNLPDINGLEVLDHIQKSGITTPTIILTGYHSVESAVKAMKLGAEDYLKKPIDPVELNICIERVMERFSMEREITYLQTRLHDKDSTEQFIGRGPAVRKVLELVEKVSTNDQTTVLLTGESGTGKTLVARLIHDNSPRKDQPFVNVACSAISENLLESELMGHKRGAFTDAVSEKVGLLEMADNGTLFMDEIGDMNLSLQVKILKVIEEKTFRKVGGVVDIKVDTRILAATNRDLEELVKQGKFREDLYYRLNVIPVHIPPLRDRKEDIPMLIDFFIKKFNAELGRKIKGTKPPMMQILRDYHWPGNLRELRNVVERAVLLSDGDFLKIENLPDSLLRPQKGQITTLRENFALPQEGLDLSRLEKNLIEQALQRTGGNVSKAARLLSIPRDKLRYRVKKFGINLEKIL